MCHNPEDINLFLRSRIKFNSSFMQAAGSSETSEASSNTAQHFNTEDSITNTHTHKLHGAESFLRSYQSLS